MDNTIFSDKKYSATTLLYKIVNDECLMLSENYRIKEECKYDINIPRLNIQNSRFIGKPEDKFETLLFLPPNPQRIAEGGLRTKGLFKFSYKLVNNQWHICDLEGNPAIPAPKELQEKINNYLRQNSQLDTVSELPLITVITVVYNGAKTLEQTIQSVINQTYPNVEYIIIDGGSSDGTLDIIKKYEDCIDYWVSEPDEGIYDAMNKGVTLAFGEWLNMLNSGDSYYNPRVIEKIMLNNYDPSISAIAGKWVIDYIGNIILYEPNPYKMLEKPGWHINHQAFFYRLYIHKKIGLYDTKYRFAADHEFYFRIITNGLEIFTTDLILIKFDFGKNASDSITAKLEDFVLRTKYLGFKFKELIYTGSILLKYIIRKILEAVGLHKIVLLYRRKNNKKLL